MALAYKIWDFPNSLPVKSQLFYAPGAVIDGGFTAGGVQVDSPEPGGRGFLMHELSLQTGEVDAPWVSWLTSMTNALFRIRLTVTPQLVPDSQIETVVKGDKTWNNGKNWSNDQPWDSDVVAFVTSTTTVLEGKPTIYVDMLKFGKVLKHGHCVGIDDTTHVIQDIVYSGNKATITISPPLRKKLSSGDIVKLRPDFVGRIMNASEFREVYDASNVGFIKPARLIFGEFYK